MIPFKSRVVSNNVTNKTFNYSKGKVSLRFVLRIDIKTELKDFLELLQRAQEEIEEEIKTVL